MTANGSLVSLFAFRLLFIPILCVAAAGVAEADIATERQWGQFVGEFREHHNFGLLVGTSSTRWTVNGLGLVHQAPLSEGVYIKGRYSFHIPILQGLGFFLGSSLGYQNHVQDNDSKFDAGYSIHLPGLLTGIAYNISPAYRLGVGFDVYLERHERISAGEEDEDLYQLSMTMLVYDIMATVDIFSQIDWGIRFEAHARNGTYINPSNSQNKVTGAEVAKSEIWAGLGLVMHLL